MEYSAAATINASPETVWAILTNGPRYPSWNPTVVRVDGEIEVGKKITVIATISPDRAFPVTIAELVPNQRMVWRGGLPLGLFKGVRTFTLTPNGEGTQFGMHEVFSGPLLGLIKRSMVDLQPSFDEFARSLKLHAEG
jgi:hypothetical protein